jgi:SAM-dependent methyltransferase
VRTILRRIARPMVESVGRRDALDMTQMLEANPPSAVCSVCGAIGQYRWQPIIGPWLALQWRLNRRQLTMINIQQGHQCAECGQSLRVRALARAIVDALHVDPPLASGLQSLAGLRVLEINPAGGLASYLDSAEMHQLTGYPAVDMQCLPFPDGSFDVVVHSDTLEHVPDAKKGLSECLRVAGSGWVVFTTPILGERLSRRRATHWPFSSYHGGDIGRSVVYHEFGADLWVNALAVGATTVVFDALDFPYAVAVACRAKSTTTSGYEDRGNQR